MFIYSPPNDFNQDNVFKNIPLYQSNFYKRWQESSGRKVVTLSIDDETNRPIAYIQCVQYTLPFIGTIWTASGGPIGKFPSLSIEEEFFTTLKEKCKEEDEKTFAIRIQRKPESKYIKISKSEKIEGSFTQPIAEKVIYMKTNLDENVQDFSKNTRKLVRRFEKDIEDVSVRVEDNDFIRYFEEIHSLLEGTSKKRGFSLHEKSFYKNLFESLQSTPNYGSLILGYTEGSNSPDAFALMVFNGDNGYHTLAGANEKAYQEELPSLVLYSAIKESFNKNLKSYNLGGISIGGTSLDSLSIFKNKFGGSVLVHPPLYDLVTNRFKYILFRILRTRPVSFLRRNLSKLKKYIFDEITE